MALVSAAGMTVNEETMLQYCHPWLLNHKAMVAEIPADLAILTKNEIFGLKEGKSVGKPEMSKFLLSTKSAQECASRRRGKAPVKEVTKRKRKAQNIAAREKIACAQHERKKLRRDKKK